MSLVRLLAEGAGEAVKLVPLVFTLGFAPAQAHLPRAVPVQAEADAGPAPMLQPVANSPAPTLIAQHLTIAFSDEGSQVQATSVFRNDTDEPIAARYSLPLAGVVTLQGVDEDTDEADEDNDSGCGGADADDADETADAAQFTEAGEVDPQRAQSGVLWLDPGDEVTLVSVRPATVFERDSRRRVVLVLPPAPTGQAAPQFSAEIDVDSTRPIVALGSATHGGDVDGLGSSRARLFIPNGRVYEARFLSVDFELGTVKQEVARHWGNEDRLPIAAR
ncbi:MAG TPA: hypothetical protein VLW55_08325 [Burkholderiaceae bacterium]|nr:hypothetical protein [Burkholderiaceae bacterium]